MSNAIVISRYNENLYWVSDLIRKYKITIYNKGEIINNDLTSTKIIRIKNVGRESHTWIYHIYKNYNNLDQNTLFLQGRIDDLNCMVFKNIDNYFLGLENNTFCASRLGMLTPLHWKKNINIQSDIRYKEDWEKMMISRNQDGFRKFALKCFGDVPLFLPTSYGGCFAVKKESILKYKKEFYFELLNYLSQHVHPIEAHYMERLWCFMFSKKLPYRNALFDVIKTKIERNIFNTAL